MDDHVAHTPLDERRLTAEDAATLYGVPVERFLIWWLRGEVPFRRVKDKGRSYFVLDDPDRHLLTGRKPLSDRRWMRLQDWLRRNGVLRAAE